MIEDLSPRKRNIALALLAALVLWFAWSIRAVVNPLLLGYLLAFIVLPLVRKLKARGLGHGVAVTVVFFAMGTISLVTGAAFLAQSQDLVEDVLAVPTSAAGAPELEPNAPPGAALEGGEHPESSETHSWLDRTLHQGSEWLERWVGPGWFGSDRWSSENLLAWARGYLLENEQAKDVATNAGISAARVLGRLVGRAADAVFGIGSLVFLVPLYAFFWLFEIERLHLWVEAHLPVRYRAQFTSIGSQVGEIISSFFRGRVFISVIKGIGITLGFWAAGAPYPLLVGMTGGVLGLLPFVGGLAGFAIGALAASLSYPWFAAILLSGAIFSLMELFEGYVLMPRVLGKSLGLSDVAVLFSVTAGGAALGLLGVLIALPLAAVFKVLFLEFVEPALQQFASE